MSRFKACLRFLLPPLIFGALESLRRWLWKRRASSALRGQSRLHLACGNHPFEGWVNMDLYGGPPVLRWDLTQPIPARNASFELVYCEHFIEHISLHDAQALLRECRRLLRAGGILRLSTPSLETLIAEYQRGRTTEWIDVGWRPETPCQMLNEALHLWGHQFVYDLPELTAQLLAAGFTEVRQVGWRQSHHPALRDLERRPHHQELILEALV